MAIKSQDDKTTEAWEESLASYEKSNRQNKLELERNENISQFLKNLKPHNKKKYVKRPAKTTVAIKNERGIWYRNDLDKSVTFAII